MGVGLNGGWGSLSLQSPGCAAPSLQAHVHGNTGMHTLTGMFLDIHLHEDSAH